MNFATYTISKRSTHVKAQSDLAAAQQARTKLTETLPHYREQAEAYANLAKEGYVILRAEVWVSNEDVGFIHQGEPTKIKFASYQFQKYGMVDGQVAHLSADATDNTQQGAGQSAPPSAKSPNGQPFAYRALVDLKAQELIADGVRHALSPGMQVTAEIHLGTRTILEYLLSPVMGAFQEAGRER